MERQPCVYILARSSHGTLYTGVTSNFLQRIYQHREGTFDGHTKRYQIKRLVWFERHEMMGSAILREKQTRDHLSVMGGMTAEGKVYTLVRQRPLNGSHSIAFLAHLQRVANERLLVIWDGSPIHRRGEVMDFVAETRRKIRLEALPGYAPDLNPWDEGGWNHLKHVQMRNVVCRDLEGLHEQFHLAIDRLRHRPHVVRSFFAQAGLPLG